MLRKYVVSKGEDEESTPGSQSLGRAIQEHLASLPEDESFIVVPCSRKPLMMSGLEGGGLRGDAYRRKSKARGKSPGTEPNYLKCSMLENMPDTKVKLEAKRANLRVVKQEPLTSDDNDATIQYVEFPTQGHPEVDEEVEEKHPLELTPRGGRINRLCSMIADSSPTREPRKRLRSNQAKTNSP